MEDTFVRLVVQERFVEAERAGERARRLQAARRPRPALSEGAGALAAVATAVWRRGGGALAPGLVTATLRRRFGL